MIGSDVLTIPEGGRSLYGKTAAELMDNVRVLENGDVLGTFQHVTDFTGFSDNKAEQSGNYMFLTLGEKYKGKTKTVQRTSGSKGAAKESADDDWIIRLSDGADTVYTIKADEVDDLTLNFARATLKDE